VHRRFGGLDVDDRHLVDAAGSPDDTSDAVVAAFRAGRLLATTPPSTR
jgi:hypothetical protein